MMREISVDYARLQRINLREPMVPQVYEVMRRRIIDLSWPPGQVLAKAEIAEALGVSQSPIREALIKLEHEGLVSIVPRSRTVVSWIDIQHAKEAQFLRLSVEIQVLRTIAAGTDSSEGLWDLSMALKRQEFFASQGDMKEFAASDNAFHRILFRMAGVDGLWEVVRSMRAHIDRMRHLDLPSQGKVTRVLDQHVALVEALRRRDADGAVNLMREHLGATLADSERLQAKFPKFFTPASKPDD